MILDLQARPELARRYRVIDLDTGEVLTAWYADDATGEWRGPARDARGRFYSDPADPSKLAVVAGVGRLEIRPVEPPP